MAGFTGFPFSYNTSPSSSSTSSSASSAGGGSGIPYFAAATSVSSLGAPSPPIFGSSYSSPFEIEPSSNGFSFPSPNNSSMPSDDSNTTPTDNDEATIRKILESIETLEKLAKIGAFPQEKLDEIKKEIQNKYPNIFSTKKPGQNNTTDNYNTNASSTTVPNDSLGWESYYTNQQEYWKNYRLEIEQQVKQQREFWKNYQLEIEQQVKQQREYWKNHHLNIIQQQVNQQRHAQNQIREQYMKMYSTNNSGALINPNYFGNGVHYPSYNYNNNNNSSAEGWKMALEMIGKTSNDDLFNNILGNTTGSGTDGFSALSFLGSLLGGGFGF